MEEIGEILGLQMDISLTSIEEARDGKAESYGRNAIEQQHYPKKRPVREDQEWRDVTNFTLRIRLKN